MRCDHCGRPYDDTQVLSRHRVADGLVRYRRCACGAVSVELLRYDRTSSPVASAAGSAADLSREPTRSGATCR